MVHSFHQALEAQELWVASSLQSLAPQWTWQSLQAPTSSPSSAEGSRRLSAFCWEGWERAHGLIYPGGPPPCHNKEFFQTAN